MRNYLINKRVEKATRILNKYKTEINGISNVKEANNWKAKVLDSLKIYLGVDSPLYMRFKESYFTIKRPSENIYDASLKENFKLLLQDVIDHITQNGVQQDYVKTNFLSSFSTGTILGGLLTGATLIFFIGKFVGTTEKEREVSKMESQIQTMESKLAEKEKNIQNKEADIFKQNQALQILKQNNNVLKIPLINKVNEKSNQHDNTITQTNKEGDNIGGSKTVINNK